MPSRKVTAEERAAAIAELREILKEGETVYTIIRHVSQSGMLRVIDLCVVRSADDRYRDNKPYIRRLGWLVAKALDYRYDRDRQGVKVSGCGMDMGFSVVYDLSRALFPSGGKDANTGEVKTDGGYALRQEWL